MSCLVGGDGWLCLAAEYMQYYTMKITVVCIARGGSARTGMDATRTGV